MASGFLRTSGEVTFDPIAPERANREGDQPLPKAGKHDVLAELAATVLAQLAARRAIGIRRYGTPLQTWNGRDVHQDLDDELLDALAYSRQAKQERRDLEAEVARLRADLRDEQGTREGLEKRLGRIWALIPESIRKDASTHDVEDAVSLLATAVVAAEQAAFKCCARNAWGDGEHTADCQKRRLEAERDAVASDLETAKRTFACGMADLMAQVETLRGERDAARANFLGARDARDAALSERDRLSRELALEVAARRELEERLGGSGG